jgi:hypothetical protein
MIGTLAPTKLAGAALFLMLCLPAHAADIAFPYTKAPPRYNWAGFYGGANIGGAVAEENGIRRAVLGSSEWRHRRWPARLQFSALARLAAWN